MQANFFGTDADVTQVWHWLFEVPGTRVCETYSRPDNPCRWFETWDALEQAGGTSISSLAAWSPDFGGEPKSETIAFAPETRRQMGGNGRTILRSPAFIAVQGSTQRSDVLHSSRISCWSEKAARQRSNHPQEMLDQVNWKIFESVSSMVVRRLRKSAPAKLGACPIVPDAWEKFKAGEVGLWNWGSECRYPSDLISEK